MLVPTSLIASLLCFAHCQQTTPAPPIVLPSTIYNYSNPQCSPANNNVQREQIRNELEKRYCSAVPACSCNGSGCWTRAAYLNMSDPDQQCPSSWTLVTSPIRSCGRRSMDARTCDSVVYPVRGRTYSSVCGRIEAYQRGRAGAFYHAVQNVSHRIDLAYLDGVSVTHGVVGLRQHIWSFVGAFYEQDPHYSTEVTCPCSNSEVMWPHQIPSFIQNDYFCDTGNPGPGFNNTTVYTDDPLWDGSGCSSNNNTCCEFNTPPWFCKTLPQPTSDDLEIRNCFGDPEFSEDKLITLIDIHIK